ncbi:MAG: AAA family ATPase, partial [Bacteroidetes bacterium]
MLTRIQIKNFKRFESVDLELGKNVVFIGPNNSGKTTILQALALWEIGLHRWNEKKQNKAPSEKRSGVQINRNDLISLPVPNTNLLWNDLHVRKSERSNDKQIPQNIRIDILVEGISNDKSWTCGLEFDFANAEFFHCRPLRLSENNPLNRMEVPLDATDTKIAFLPPMSGLAATEPLWQPGRISVLLGEGQTAQVLRNICYQIYSKSPSGPEWNDLVSHIKELFGVMLLPPLFIKERGEITMMFKEPSGIQLDLSSSGRGLQQTLLLLAHLYANPKTVLLLDEPDAHLEVLRQRQIYQLLTSLADKLGSQIIAASHSEIVLNEAAGRDVVVAFVGKPHRIDDRVSQVLKALREIGYDQYYQAEQTGWVLYLEGSTDLAILQTLAKKLNHPASEYLEERPFVHYIGNQPQKARDHFFALREAKTDLVGITIIDNIEKELQPTTKLV